MRGCRSHGSGAYSCGKTDNSPGVGSFDNGIIALQQRGLFDAIKEKMERAPVPLLGVCLGMQLLGEGSDEVSLRALGLLKAHLGVFSLIKAAPIGFPHGMERADFLA